MQGSRCLEERLESRGQSEPVGGLKAILSGGFLGDGLASSGWQPGVAEELLITAQSELDLVKIKNKTQGLADT